MDLIRNHNNDGFSHSNMRIPVIYFGLKINYLLVVYTLYFCFVHSISANEVDSTSVMMPEIRVEASRILSSTALEFSPFAVIDKSKIEQTGSLQLQESLQYLPGIFIKDYGGLGGLKTVSVRGAAANQTLIMLNGIRLNSSQNGIADLSNLPLKLIGSMEIVRTGLSNVYGGNASGGVINIIPDNQANNVYEINGSLGSFNEQFAAMSASGKLLNMNVTAIAEYKHSNGDYPMNLLHYGENITVRRDNADFTNHSYAINADYHGANYNINSFLMHFNSERGVPGAVLQGHIESPLSRMSESGTVAAINYDYLTEGGFNFNAGLNTGIKNMNYRDRNLIGIGGKELDNNFYSKDIFLMASVGREFDNTNIKLSAEGFSSSLEGDMLSPDVDKSPYRAGLSFALSADKRFQTGEICDISLFASARWDMFNDNNPVLSPFFAFMVEPFGTNLKFKSSISRNFRMPSFNELYYLNYGTSGLKPETSISFNQSVNYKLSDFEFEVNYFNTSTDNLILSVPKSPAVWSAQNIGKSTSEGVELLASGIFLDGVVGIDFNYTYRIVKDMSSGTLNYGKDLVYTPNELININLISNLPYNIMIALNCNYSSFRYSLQSADPSSILPEYYTLNLKIFKEFEIVTLLMKISASIDNLTDQRYAVVKNYPMPGRIFRFGLIFSNKDKKNEI